MSDGVARVPVLPRKIAAGVSVLAVARSGWAIAAATLLVCIPGVIELFAREHYTADLAEPLIALGLMIVTIGALAVRTSTFTLIFYLIVGSGCVYLFLHGMLDGHASLLPAALVLVNRPESALVLVGTAGLRPLPAVAWGLAGFLAGAGVTALVDFQLGIPLQLGNGPAITLANYCAVYLGLSLIQRAQRRRVPDFLLLRHETRRIEAGRTMEHRSIALLHDTVLNDLALVINGPDKLDKRIRDRMRSDIATMLNTDVMAGAPTEDYVDPADASLRNQVMAIVSDFQWRGLSVEVTGDTGTVAHMAQEGVTAAVGALRASLENVLAHSGADSAEIIVSATGSDITWTVSDAGRGFDPRSIAADRLGLRSSVFHRVESAGGVVKVWSAPGSGTSILFTLPVIPMTEAHPESADG